ncbi:MAG TPA: RyR domain-containing protein [Pyrinomonadaceae bacterium]|nr:RyR domain-containing protein [Pyrinomonadaceae bacterium]
MQATVVPTNSFMTIEQIARICHEANGSLCNSIGDHSQTSWDDAAEWQRESAIKGVQFALDNPDATPSAQHEAWCADKRAEGWTFGETKDAEAKTHPCLVPYDQLPPMQQAKDHLFRSIVHALGQFL